MEKIILPQQTNENLQAEIESEHFPELIHDSLFKKFFLEIASITIFPGTFLKKYSNRLMNLMSCSNKLS